MEQKTLIISCVEYYSFLKNIPGNKVFQAFQQASILTMIQESHTNFPEMDLGFYVGMIDGMIALESDADENDYAHYEERTSLISQVVSMLEQKYQLDILGACSMYYKSHTAEMVSEDRNGFYQKTATEICAMVEEE
ncbi:hypothetical protein [Anaerotignum sp. MB30-C6]|uniref:hypothetical protein n=1 Tax=Anaerotignum sp. MB30-C6 TaxID=3070814 RepID=UPI0027DB1292|nr:hypothetical protein [Anaerotignum sp. MB30-C6]WMI80499.1 hypothetical protein RBQ60_11765 [Anaerotignum sp. MB30-C6]